VNDTLEPPAPSGPYYTPPSDTVQPRPPRRRPSAWLVVGLVLAVLFLAQGAAWAFAIIGQQTDSLSQSRPAQSELVIRLSSGNVRVTADPSATQASTLYLDAERHWSQTRPEIVWKQVDMSVMSLTVRCGPTLVGWCSADLDLRVPEGTKVRVDDDSGDVFAQGLKDVTLHTDSGRASGEELAGQSELKTGSGDVSLKGGTGDYELTTDSGDIDVVDTAATHLITETDSGSIRIDLASDPERAFATTDSGDITISLPDTPGVAYQLFVTADSGSTSREIRTDPDAQRSVTAKSGSGDVTVAYR
jgi:hypothetical protein